MAIRRIQRRLQDRKGDRCKLGGASRAREPFDEIDRLSRERPPPNCICRRGGVQRTSAPCQPWPGRVVGRPDASTSTALASTAGTTTFMSTNFALKSVTVEQQSTLASDFTNKQRQTSLSKMSVRKRSGAIPTQHQSATEDAPGWQGTTHATQRPSCNRIQQRKMHNVANRGHSPGSFNDCNAGH